MGIDRQELVRLFILDVIADDYEGFERISKEVTDLGRRCGQEISISDIRSALATLIGDDLARAYRLSPTAPIREIGGVPSPCEFETSYYWITQKGKEVQASDCDCWPFDEQGSVRRNWSLSKSGPQ
jgi:hypothetical protein